MLKKVWLFAVLLLMWACGENKLPEKAEGLDLLNMDTTVRPQDDLFRFVNGGWLDRTEIPADRGSWGSFNELFEHNNQIVLEVLKEAAGNPNYPEGTDQRKAADFYSIGMDSLLAEKAALSPLQPIFQQIENIKDRTSLQDYLTQQELDGGGAFFEMGILSDLKDAKHVSFYFFSSGIGLPERDYYLKQDDKSKETREQYKKHIVNMLSLAGESPDQAKRSAEDIMGIETTLAKATLTKEESRNPYNLYHKYGVADLKSLVPSLNWTKYFADLQVTEDSIIVAEPEFMKASERIFASGRWDDVREYLKWTTLRQAADYLNNEFVNESFEFNGKHLRGVEQMRPRWKRVLDVTDRYLGEAIGQLYVQKAFPPEAKAKALEMVEQIKLAMADRIKQLEWMSDSTKQMALNKLRAFNVKIGYPDEWKSYVGLKVETSPEQSSYFQNVLNARRFAVKRELNKLGKPVDRKEWGMTPQTVNAYYNPLLNEIVFPAGILQPPFYNYKADDAVNYGGIGAVIGHEVSHGFDDQGSQFDPEGNLRNWWGEVDLERFKSKGKALADQFSQYEPLPGLPVQGEYTLGENIGDLGGLNVAFEALQRNLREHGRPGLIDGYTPEQRFFLSWATIWRGKYRDETLRTLVNTDPHAPGMYRANGPVSNMEQFYAAFDVKEGDKLFREPAKRVKIW